MIVHTLDETKQSGWVILRLSTWYIPNQNRAKVFWKVYYDGQFIATYDRLKDAKWGIE